MNNFVTETAAASPEDALAHFSRRLSFETDCADVADALARGATDFVLLHVVGTRQAYERRHVPGAIHLPHREITRDRMAEWPEGILFVAYCAGPHCNGADRAAMKLAELGFPVKIMIGGLTGWVDEGLELAVGGKPGRMLRVA